MARKLILQFKKEGRKCNLIFVSPYINDSYIKNKTLDAGYDFVEYPGIEKTPPRYAILKRNYKAVDNSDVIIAYVFKTWGGAYKTLEYAYRKNKQIINLYKKTNSN